VDEVRCADESPVDYAQRLAVTKSATGPDDSVVVAADTVVHRRGRVYGKPESRAQAHAMLEDLSGGWHTVTTGVCVRQGVRSRSFQVSTQVRFRVLPADEVERYVASGEADDKAGAYGIQGLGGALVAEVRGSWTNVMGLPLEETLAAIAEVRS